MPKYEYQNISCVVQDHLARITLERPEYLNAWSPGIIGDLLDVFEKVRDDTEVRAVLITGSGRGFCAGAYVKDPNTHANVHGPAVVLNSPSREATLLDLMWTLPKPLVAAVNGVAYGAGLNMVLCADLVVTAEEATFCFPMAKLGIIPAAPGVSALALRVGTGRAAEIGLLGEPVDGKAAAAMGLANKAVSAEELMPAAIEWGEKLAANAPLSVRLIKEDLRESMEHHIDERATWMRDMFCFMSEDREEGHAAWREGRRKPNFQGK